METVIKSRSVSTGASERKAVEVDDQARLLVRFARGCAGTMEVSWTATGRTMQLVIEAARESSKQGRWLDVLERRYPQARSSFAACS